jgi:anaerobic C4-dicarboxylate transporter DcuA
VTIVAPLTTWTFTFVAGTGHIVYPLLPVIYETAHRSGIRPERPMAVATIASQQAITASPVAAATAAMIGLFSEKGLTQWGLPEILMICVPATLTGVVAAAIVSMFVGKDLKDDPEYQARLKAGQIPAPKTEAEEREPLKPSAKPSAYLFLCGVALVVFFGFFPEFRKLPGAKAPLAMPIVIEIVMMSVAAIMLAITRVNVDEVPKTATLRAGVVAVIGIFGLAWLGDSFIAAHKDVIVPAIGDWAKAAPWTFAFGLFFASVLLYSQAATTRALMPLGMALGIPPQFLIAMFPSVNGYFFIPTYGSLIAAINFDLAGTTRIGRYVLNHSFMIPGLIATAVAVITGLAIARMLFGG